MNAVKGFLQQNVPGWILPPFIYDDRIYNVLAETPPVQATMAPPQPAWTCAKKSKNGERMPQTIAHRGYKAQFPENSMDAFEGAVEVGAHGLETDVHLSKDEVVMISHDSTLKRCYGIDKKVIDCDWDYLSKLRTLRTPQQPMPRLLDLLEYLAKPGSEHVWLLLDIKLTNNAENIIRLIASTIAAVTPSPSTPWNQRIVLGIWASKFLPLCAHYLPTFAITNIGFSIPYAREFFAVPNVCFNTLQLVLMGPRGRGYVRDVKAEKRPLLTWTVNGDYSMRWCISKGVDGVITDDPKRFLEVCERWESGDRELGHMPWIQWGFFIWLNMLVVVFEGIFRWKYGGKKQRKAMAISAGPLESTI